MMSTGWQFNKHPRGRVCRPIRSRVLRFRMRWSPCRVSSFSLTATLSARTLLTCYDNEHCARPLCQLLVHILHSDFLLIFRAHPTCLIPSFPPFILRIWYTALHCFFVAFQTDRSIVDVFLLAVPHTSCFALMLCIVHKYSLARSVDESGFFDCS